MNPLLLALALVSGELSYQPDDEKFRDLTTTASHDDAQADREALQVAARQRRQTRRQVAQAAILVRAQAKAQARSQSLMQRAQARALQQQRPYVAPHCQTSRGAQFANSDRVLSVPHAFGNLRYAVP